MSKSTTTKVIKDRIMLILKSRHLSINKLAKATGYTREGLSAAIHRESMNMKTLDDICKYLDVYPGFFTGEYPLLDSIPRYRTIPISWIHEWSNYMQRFYGYDGVEIINTMLDDWRHVLNESKD